MYWFDKKDSPDKFFATTATTDESLPQQQDKSLPQQADEILAEIFGFRSFRPHQREIIQALMSGQDVFAVMPTGGGKSLCYQLPARLMPGTAVVVSPLIALMKDQVDNARALGLSAATLNSSLNPMERSQTWEMLSRGGLDLLFVSPERLNNLDFLERLARRPLSFIAIDEAHCVSEWGHDFRPDYLALGEVLKYFPKLPIAAFTATATHRVAQDITERLGLRSPFLVRASFNRPNLYYQATLRDKLEKQIAKIMEIYPGESGLIYRATRKKVEKLAANLAAQGLSVLPYHAGLSDKIRHQTQEDFRHDRCQVVVATVAFGMGIDKSDVRFVIHGDLPKNLESYYQETGRAGRDGETAHCALFYGGQEMVLWRRFAVEISDETQKQAALGQLQNMIDYAQRDDCRRQSLLGYFHEILPENSCGACDVCRGEVERVEATIPAQMALSAMVRTKGRFGSTYLADILMGADTAKIMDNGHHLLPTYGVGREYGRRFWRDLFRALVSRGLAENTGGQFPILGANPQAWPILRGEEKFYISRAAVRVRRERFRGTSNRDSDHTPMSGTSEKLLRQLKKLRRQLALAREIPPYLVFSDRSLQEMAQLQPRTEEEFMDINGVGTYKLEKYGPEFLALINAYLDQ